MSLSSELEMEFVEIEQELKEYLEDLSEESQKWFKESLEREKKIIAELKELEKQRAEDERINGPLVVPQDLEFRKKMYGFSEQDAEHIKEGKQTDKVVGTPYTVFRSK